MVYCMDICGERVRERDYREAEKDNDCEKLDCVLLSFNFIHDYLIKFMPFVLVDLEQ